MRDLGALGGSLDLSQSIAYDINNVGQVVGESFNRFSRELTRAFLWTANSGMQYIGGLEPRTGSGIAYAINDAGQVVGQSWTDSGAISRVSVDVVARHARPRDLHGVQ